MKQKNRTWWEKSQNVTQKEVMWWEISQNVTRKSKILGFSFEKKVIHSWELSCVISRGG